MPAAIDGAIQAQGASMSTCKKYRFARKDEGVYNKRSVDHVYEDDDSSSSEEDERKQRKKERKEKKRESRHRDKRQMPPSTIDPTSGQTIIGERFILSCTSKGVTTDATGTVSLCSSCWMWRRLPNNYSPQYINELICDTTDRNCLSGYATCGVGHRTIEVIRNDTGVMTTVALSAGSYCECRVAANSAIQSLVSGAGLGTSLPAINSTAGSN
ncbi:hypothetical protein ANCCAN_05260 [Ancylostoma caninum]|uniref:Uncharacterized protein n=1 Tax=Ancylostoma caninum TaxID=29170 RepID=A0A368GW81_ANCCA|nr:hypothetical protein ANCCAN_05260 [Ancylostoma caninum]